MKKKTARALALEKLEYFTRISLSARKSSIKTLPWSIWVRIKKLHNYCPLCELFCVENPKDGKHCEGCPLTPPFCNDHSDTALRNNIALLKVWETEEN